MRISALSWSSLTAALVLALPASAQDAPVAFTGSIAVATDYTFRGISQTLEDPAVQGGITGAAGPVYAGLWGSNVDFGEAFATADEERAGATAEIDLFGGVKVPLGIADADLGFTYYAYPGADDASNYDFWEVALALSKALGPVSAAVKGAYSPDFFLSSGNSLYLGGSLGFGIPNTPLSLAAAVGKQSIDEEDTFGTPDYIDYSVGATLSVLGIGVGAAVVGTNIEDDECFGGGAPFGGTCGNRVILSVSRGM
jgi:uncharacterized protein (TIGR02001 family)